MGAAELIAIGTFLLVGLLVAVPYYLFIVRPEVATEDILRQRIRTGGGGAVQKARVTLLKEVERLSTIGPLNQLLGSDSAIARNLRDMIRLSGLKVTPGQMVLGSACLAMAAFLAVTQSLHRLPLAVIACVIAGGLPFVVLRIIHAKRLSKFEEQFPEAVDLIARTLRAGHAFTTGLRMAADELPEPIAAEFKLLYDQQNYGLPLTDGLRAMAQRIPIIDARFFVTAVLTQREAGGNLAEVLDNLTAVIRERFKIKRQLRVISAHGRMTGMVLAALPPALGLMLYIRTPEHFTVLFTDPLGIRMVIMGVSLQIVGALLIHKITKVQYESAHMSPNLQLTLFAVFFAVALLSGAVAWSVTDRPSAARRRLSELAEPRASSLLVAETAQLTDAPEPLWDSLVTTLPTSRGTVKRLRREMLLAGFQGARVPALFSLAEVVLPILLALPPVFLLEGTNRWMGAIVGGIIGYMMPGFFLRRRLAARQREIENGLADALDLLVLCLEAGSSLDQAIVKAGDELEVAYPALGDQLRILIAEMRAGKPRLEVFRALADRTKVDDVRALVAMLVQTDRFGTSIAQALRTHAEVCRTKRRQRAEERAQKVGVKLVFPLVFCLFPALYVVMLGPAFIRFSQVFGEMGAK